MSYSRTVEPAQPLGNHMLEHPTVPVTVPTYDRNAVTPGVVHIGVGGFHRAHQGVYFEQLAEQGITDWGVVGVGLRSRGMQSALEPQDLLYSVVERHPDADAVSVVGIMIRYLYAPEDPEAVLEALSDPRIRLVTITLTANAYHVDVATGAFDETGEDVAADLANPEAPVTFFGYVVEALRRRRAAGNPPFTVLSCDNVPSNGQVARSAVVSFARLRDPDLATWLEEHVAFPNSVVDRITPESTDELADHVQQEYGIEDNSPVPTEPFRQWIIEDSFCNERPPLDRVGVQFVSDTWPYELVKKRMLNGGHCALGYLGCLAGHRTTADVMADPTLRAYVTCLLESEIMPLLPEVPGIDLDEYKTTLLERLANPKMGDELTRLCRRGSTKIPSYLLPSLTDAVTNQRPHTLLTLGVAGWLRYLRGTDCAGETIEIEDARRDELAPLVASGTDPRPILRERSIFGELGEDETFAEGLEETLRRLEEHGPRVVAEQLVARERGGSVS
jgi:fructuronate reductase/mannitol 2-dehydrogenase